MTTSRRHFQKQVEILGGETDFPSTHLAVQTETAQGWFIPDIYGKKDVNKVRLIFAIWNKVQIREACSNDDFDFRIIMSHVTQTLNSRIQDMQTISGKANENRTAEKKPTRILQPGKGAPFILISTMNS